MDTEDTSGDDASGDDTSGEAPVERAPDQSEPRDTDRVAARTDAPDDPGDTGFDSEAPGNFVDDTESDDVPEPNEPA